MRRFLRKHFALTENGAKAVTTASIIAFFVNVGYMGLMMIAMYFGKNVLKGDLKPGWIYLLLIAVAMIIVYFIVDLDYIKTFNTTYKESSDLRLEIADRLKELPLSYFSKHDLSDLAQTIMQDVSDIEHAVSHSIPRCIGYGVFLLVVAGLLLMSNICLGLAIVAPLIIGFLMMFLPKNLQKKWTGKYFWRSREHSEAFQEAIELQREIKSYGLGEENYKRVSSVLDDSERLRIKAEMFQAIPMLVSTSFMKVTLGIVTVVAAALLKAQAIELIYVIGFLLAAVRLVDAVGAIDESFAEIFYLDARINRINELRSLETQQGKDVELKNFDIELKNVSFAYDKHNNVVSGVSFTAKQNEVMAIVGPSGCGKSTVLRLISRLFDYDLGQIIIDGRDIKDISTDSLFKKISFVFQDVILFNASVLENIRIGRPDATDEEVKRAAQQANCEEFVSRLSEGYNSLIGENGSKLSGGERQRISIARAILKNAPILLLDEISASLDVENEIEIQKSLNELIVGKTVIIVSHRLKSIEKVDKIIVMDEGKVTAIGTHEELMRNSELYNRLIDKSTLTERFRY